MKTLIEAVLDKLLEAGSPAVTDYELYRTALAIATDRAPADSLDNQTPGEWDRKRSRNLTRRLVRRRALVSDQDFRSGVWRIVQAIRAGTAEEVACIADPFCYLSHLSAMQRYGLTDRSPTALHITRPSRPVWNVMKMEKLARELPPEHVEEASKTLVHIGMKPSLRRRPVTIHETRHPSRTTQVRGEGTRVVEIGQVFVDMLSEPDLCGGIRHALEVWARHAPDWLDPIVAAVADTASSIVKVRAGHILAERLGIADPRIEAWKAFAQRGGSRKLDPDAPYAPNFSEAWMISLNA